KKDSNMTWLARKRTPVHSQMWMSHQHADEVGDETYRRVCYGDPGIRERLSVLLLLQDGRRIAISYYRSWTLEPFAAPDFDLIEMCAPLLMQGVITHIRQLHPDMASSPSAALHERILVLLPNRERQVVSHILSG